MTIEGNEELTASLEPDDEALAFQRLREQRNKLLFDSDWTQTPDSPVDRNGWWGTYREKLRDLPETVADPANPDWPQPPVLESNGTWTAPPEQEDEAPPEREDE